MSRLHHTKKVVDKKFSSVFINKINTETALQLVCYDHGLLANFVISILFRFIAAYIGILCPSAYSFLAITSKTPSKYPYYPLFQVSLNFFCAAVVILEIHKPDKPAPNGHIPFI